MRRPTPSSWHLGQFIMWRRLITLPPTGARRILLTPAIHMPLAIAIDIAIVIAIAKVVDTAVAIAVISNKG
ncbi:MAG: hypothetical protein RLZZ596_1209 [Pseudomonadota bacterium]